MPRKALSRSSLLVPLAIFGLLADEPAHGQSTFPNTQSGFVYPSSASSDGGTATAGGPSAPMPGTGNPFVRRGFPRSTLMAPPAAQPIHFDSALTPVTFDQPAATPLPAAVPGRPDIVAQPTTSVLPNYSDMPPSGASPGLISPGVAAPIPQSPTAQPAAVAGPPAQLQGVELLRSLAVNPPASGHPLQPILQWCDGALVQMQGLADYTCTFKKREFIDGKMQEQASMYVKSRTQPLSVYLHFLAPRDVHGQEAIYVEGRNEGRLLAHPVGLKKTLVGTVALEPTHPQAMDGNRHPITDFGLRRLCERYREGLQKDLQFGECEVRVIDSGVVVEGRPCVCIQLTHPVPRKEFTFNVTRLFVDAEWNIPCRFEAYAWPSRPGEQPMLVEEYTYANLKLNVNLTDADFDVRNPQYRF